MLASHAFLQCCLRSSRPLSQCYPRASSALLEGLTGASCTLSQCLLRALRAFSQGCLRASRALSQDYLRASDGLHNATRFHILFDVQLCKALITCYFGNFRQFWQTRANVSVDIWIRLIFSLNLMSNLVFDSYNVEFLLVLGHCWPITADVFRILYSPYRQLSLDVQLSIALYMALYSNIKFSVF